MFGFLKQKFYLLGLGGMIILVLFAGWQTLMLERTKGKVIGLEGDVVTLTKANNILQMKVTALENTQFINDQIRQDLQKGTNEVRDAQQRILDKVTRDVDQIRLTPAPEASVDPDRRTVADSVYVSLHDAYCLAVPTAVDCTP